MHGRRIGDAMGKLQSGRRIVMSMSLCLRERTSETMPELHQIF